MQAFQRPVGAVFLSALVACALITVSAVLTAPATAQGAGEAVMDTVCAACHDTLAESFLLTPHGSGNFVNSRHVVGTTPCEACHGDGEAHADSGDPELITVPSGELALELCSTCHGDHPETSMLSTSAHARAGVECGSCHRIHPADDALPRPNLLAAHDQQELCGSCHPAAEASFRRPFAHDLTRSGMDCSSCHNPHGGTGEANLRLTRTGDLPCVDCHTEKRGPFVFPHVSGVVGDCMTCHQPHGSTNPHQLDRAQVHQLCLECHTATLTADTLGSQPPSFHDLRSPRYRECTVCHVAVHGSNTSPSLER